MEPAHGVEEIAARGPLYIIKSENSLADPSFFQQVRSQRSREKSAGNRRRDQRAADLHHEIRDGRLCHLASLVVEQHIFEARARGDRVVVDRSVRRLVIEKWVRGIYRRGGKGNRRESRVDVVRLRRDVNSASARRDEPDTVWSPPASPRRSCSSRSRTSRRST